MVMMPHLLWKAGLARAKSGQDGIVYIMRGTLVVGVSAAAANHPCFYNKQVT